MNRIENIKEEFSNNNKFENSFNDDSKGLMEKQKLLEQLMEELLDEETKNLLDEIREQMEDIDKNKMLDILEQMDASNEDLESELDRNLELFKQFEFDKKLSEISRELDSLSIQQKKLAEELNADNRQEIFEKQKEIKKQLENTDLSIEELDEINSELQKSENLPNVDSLMKKTFDNIEDALNQIENKKLKNAKSSQKGSKETLEKMSDLFQQLQDKRNEENLAEDINLLKELLSELVHISFGEEVLIGLTNELNYNNPLYVKVNIEQNRIRSQFSVVEDSLKKLALRQPMVKGKINKEIGLVRDNLKSSIENLEKKNKPDALKAQQYTMTSINNLALLLSESLNNMQQSMNMQGSGKGKSQNQNPSQGKQGIQSLKQLQQQLQNQLQQMKDGMHKPGGEKGGKQMGEQFVRMAAKQAALRKKLQDYKNQLEKEGFMNNSGIQNAIKLMEQNERDLINKKINVNTLRRQQQINHRLLEAERAEMKRGKESKREAERVGNIRAKNSNVDLNRIFIDEFIDEDLRRSLPDLKLYYEKLYDSYLIEVEEEK